MARPTRAPCRRWRLHRLARGAVHLRGDGRAWRLDEEGIRAHAENGARKGLADRLNSHASGRRSGDQFCVYVADRLVLPALTPAGELSLDAKVRECIRKNLAFRFVVTRDGREAADLERAIRSGALRAGKPYLNPL